LLLAIVAGLVLVPAATAGRGLVFTANAGETLHGSIRAGETARPADATTRNSTGIAYRIHTEPRDVAGWISVGKPEGGTAPFTIRVPPDAEPGQHFAGIVTRGGVVGVEIDVRGPLVARFVLGSASANRRRLFLHVTNTGNVAARPRGVVSVERRNGAALERLSFRMRTFLPHTSIDYPLALKTPLRPGTYVANVQLTYAGSGPGGTQSSSAAPEFVVSSKAQPVAPPRRAKRPAQPPAPAAEGGSSAWPWVAGAAAALLAAAAVAGAVALRRRRPVTVTVTPVGEAAPSIAPCEGHHYWQVDWDSAQHGPGGDVTYVHRCRRCGLEVRAADIGEAAAKASG
jgi:hypothetical protein